MKIRTGFVSNSSSASFVVAVKRGEKCPTCGRQDPDFLGLVENMDSGGGYETTNLRCRGSEQLQGRWKRDRFEYADEEEKDSYKDLFDKVQEAEQKGYQVAEVEISYHDPSTNELLEQLETQKTIIVLWSDHRDIKAKDVKL